MGLFDKIHDTVEDSLGGAGRYIQKRARGGVRHTAPIVRGAGRVAASELGYYETLIPTPQWKRLPRWMRDDFVTIDPQRLSVKFGWKSDPNDVRRFKEQWRQHPVSSALTVGAIAAPYIRPLAAGGRAARVGRGIAGGDKAGTWYAREQAALPPRRRPIAASSRRGTPGGATLH